MIISISVKPIIWKMENNIRWRIIKRGVKVTPASSVELSDENIFNISE
jgi:hypothetical protein